MKSKSIFYAAFVLGLLVISVSVKAAGLPKNVDTDEDLTPIFSQVEEMPKFSGGHTEVLKYLHKNLRYPAIAQENGIQGRVVVQCVINKDGSVSDVQVLQGVDPSLDKEALRVVSTMPRWTPGKQRGKPVRVRYTLPITFRLQ